jgi:hypothetical protein
MSANFKNKKTELISVSQIKTNDSNPRIIKDDKFHKLVRSLQEFPTMLEYRPVIVNEDMVILAGNMRFKAAMHLGYEKVPTIIAKDLTEKQQRELIVKDNVGYGEWDWDMLANEWDTQELDEWGLDIPNFENLSEIEAKGRMAATLDEKLDTYLNATIKQIVLYFEYEEYEEVIQKLDKIAEDNSLADNSSVIKFLLDNYAQK